MNIVELKAAAFDCLVRIEQLQNELREINQKIAEEINKQKTD